MAYKNTRPNNAYKKYVSSQLQTASDMQLVVLLYEAAIKRVNVAMDNMNYKTYDVVNQNLIGTIDIITELRSSLDMKRGGEISERLDAIYEYLLKEISKANVEKSRKALVHVREILTELLSSWKEIAHTSKPKTSRSEDTSFNSNSGLSITG